MNVKYKRIRNFFNYINTQEITLSKLAGQAACINFLLEILSRRSLIDGVVHLFSDFFIFAYNTSIILLTLSVSLLFRKKLFYAVLISLIWIGLGITNFVLLSFRTTPLAAIDFQILDAGFSIMNLYLNPLQIVCILLLTAMALAAILFLWFQTPKRRPPYGKGLISFCCVLALVLSATLVSTKAEALSSTFGNLADAYEEYGFAYCFSMSLVDRGVKKPYTYSEDTINEVAASIVPDESTEDFYPNVIFLQLESFFDVNYIENTYYSSNPVPFFTKLKENYSSGFLTVPSIGAGTANTEFEILSGMSLEYFGAGEYPYKTILQTSTCESIAYNLKDLGYQTHALHNHSGSFYDRNLVFSNLGFDYYTSLEYMENWQTNPLGWAKDKMLISEISKSLASTESTDFIFAISVQAHGKYPDMQIDPTQKLTITSKDVNVSTHAIEYYINQLREVDIFLENLISTLEKSEEDIVLVLYGDHLSHFEILDEQLKNKDVFQTEYVIWSNFDMKKKNQDLYAYQLHSYVMDQLDIHHGTMTRFHQSKDSLSDYQDALHNLQYDMLYGEQIIYQRSMPYTTTPIKMGISDISISKVEDSYGSLYILGENFTPFSKVLIDGVTKETLYLNSETLLVLNELYRPQTTFTIAQVGKDGVALSHSKEYIILD